jgi:hypothetical protein
MKMNTLVLLVVASCTVRLSVGDSTMDMINKGIEAGNQIAKLLADQKIEDFGASLAKIAGKVSKYLEAFSPVLGLFQLLLPDDTYDIIEERFAEMDAKFDQVFNRSDDLGDEQLKISLKTQFGAYAREITLFSKRLDDFLKSEGKAENLFLETYDNKTFDENVMQLYMAMMKNDSGLVIDSIPGLVRDFTNENRKDTEMAMKRILHLIIQGAAIEMAYYSLTDDEKRYNTTKHDWEERISKLIMHIKMIDEDMRYNYMGQVKKDTEVLLAKMYGKSNKDFADTLYKLLSQKYEWRDWVVVAFNDVSDKKIDMPSEGAFQMTRHGRHVIVASSTKDRDTDISNVKKLLSKIPDIYDANPNWNLFKTWFFYDVDELYNMIPDKTNLKSNHVVGVGNADGSDLVARGPDNKYALFYKAGSTPNPFGKDIWFWMFALFADKEGRPTPKREFKPGPIGDAIKAHDVDE